MLIYTFFLFLQSASVFQENLLEHKEVSGSCDSLSETSSTKVRQA